MLGFPPVLFPFAVLISSVFVLREFEEAGLQWSARYDILVIPAPLADTEMCVEVRQLDKALIGRERGRDACAADADQAPTRLASNGESVILVVPVTEIRIKRYS